MKNIVAGFILTFSFTVHSSYAQSEVEPNNSASNATVMSGSTITGAINPANDVDVFSFQVNRPGVLSMNVANVPANLKLTIHMLDPELIQWVTNSSLVGGNSLGFSWNACKPGKYYIRIFEPYGSFSAQQYQVSASLDISDVYECNNGFDSAKAITLNQQITGYINSEGDRDYFKVVMPDTGQLNLSVPVLPSSMRIVLYVYDSTKTLVKKSPVPTYSGTAVTLSTEVRKGTHYIVVEDDNYNQSTSPYKLSTSFSIVTSVSSFLLQQDIINIFPNPVSGSFRIDMSSFTGIHQPYQLNIFNSKGELVLTKAISYPSANVQIATTNLQSGLYILKLVSKQGTLSRKMIITNH